MCGEKCVKCSYGIIVGSNVVLLLLALGSIGFISSTYFAGTMFTIAKEISDAISPMLLPGTLGGLSLIAVMAIIGIGTSCFLRHKLLRDGEDEEGGKAGGCCMILFIVYFFIISIFCLVFLGAGIWSASNLQGFTTSNAEVDKLIDDAQAHKANFSDAAMKFIDIAIVNSATKNPESWYTIQNVVECCGYFPPELNVPPATSDYTSAQNACANRGDTSIVDACATCKADATAEAKCSATAHYNDCQRLLKGCPLRTGTKCYGNSNSTACLPKVMEFIDGNVLRFTITFLVLWFVCTLIDFSVMALMCINCCGVHKA